MNQPDPIRDCTGLILAGGRGARLGGADKGLVELLGRPLVTYAIEALRPQVSGLLISANRNRERYAEFGLPVIADTLADFQGPLAGMLSGLTQCKTEWLACVPCDMPAIPGNLVSELLRAAAGERGLAAYAVLDGDPSYVCALLHRSLRERLAISLQAGERAVGKWLAAHNACAVAFHAPAQIPRNINTAADLRSLDTQRFALHSGRAESVNG